MSDLHAEALALSRYHRDCPTHTPFSPAYEVVGLIAERAWADLMRVPRKPVKVRGGGDGGVDYVHEAWTADWSVTRLPIDVKGVQKYPKWLLIPDGRVRPHVTYVLGFVDLIGQDVACWVGWALGSEVLAYPPVRHPRPDVLNHAMPVADLHPMRELFERLL